MKARLYIINKVGRRATCTLLVPLLLAALTGCIDFDDATQAVSVKVRVQLPEGLAGAELAGHTVTMNLGQQSISAKTDADGIATFSQIVPDVYDISTAWKMTAQEYAQLTGNVVENGKYTVAGTLSGQMLTEELTLTLPTRVTRDQSMLIGKIYFAGSKDFNNKNYIAGNYLELYNNSDEPFDVSGLYLALMESESTIAYVPGQTPDTIYAKQVFRIPAGQPRVVEPGGTLLIVNSAIDHSLSGPMEPNLLDADFEAKDSQGRTTNNPDVPALELVYSTYALISNINFLHGGVTSMAIFSTDEAVGDWPTDYAYGKTRGNRFMKIPAKSVIDAVEVLQKKAQTGVDVNTKRLFGYLDAGYVNINATTGYNGEVVYRKTIAVAEDGRKTLADTNNSQNDFDVATGISPREYK